MGSHVELHDLDGCGASNWKLLMQAGYMYDRMKEATQRMNSMRRELQVSEENQAQAIKHSRALQHTVDIMVSLTLFVQCVCSCKAPLGSLAEPFTNAHKGVLRYIIHSDLSVDFIFDIVLLCCHERLSLLIMMMLCRVSA